MQRSMPQQKKNYFLHENEFELQDGNIDNCFNFDDLFQNLWHCCSMTRIVAFPTIWLNFPQYSTSRATLGFLGTLMSSQFSSFVYALIETLISREPTWRLVVHSIHHSRALEPGVVLTPCDLSSDLS